MDGREPAAGVRKVKSRFTLAELSNLNFQSLTKKEHPDKKIKICLVIHSLQAGGMERVMSELAAYFCSKEELEVHLVLFGITRELFYKIPGNIILHQPAFRFNNSRRFVSTLRTLLFLRKTIREIKPRSILSFGEFWNNFVLLSTVALPYPVFVSDRSQPDKSLGRLQDRLRILLYRRAKGIILQSKKAKDVYLKSMRHRNIAVIGNPIREIEPGNEQEREKIVLMVGRLINSKHQDHLIEIFAGANRPDWKLWLVGYDHMKQENMDKLKTLAAELNIAASVEFLGKQDQVERIYRKVSVFAFTSSSEGFPNVIGEAMAAGLPVIAYDCVAGPSEMIRDNENGFLIPLFDKTSFTERLGQLMDDPALRSRFGQQAGEDIRQFSIDLIGERFLQFMLK